ncbi:hypothetical protein BH10BDE1_BH10BDE1_01330 [soil metagenome]
MIPKAEVVVLCFSLLLAGCGSFKADGSSDAASEALAVGVVGTPPTVIAQIPSNDGTGGSGGARGKVAFTCTGGRSVWVYVPTGTLPSDPLPVLTAFHGAGDNANNFSLGIEYLGWIALGQSEKFIVVVPSSLNVDRPSFSHFSGPSTLDEAATTNEAKSVHDCVLKEIGARYNLSISHQHWVGFSEGATFTNYAGPLMTPRLKTAVIFAGAAGRRPSADLHPIPMSFIVGSLDSADAIQQIANQWQAAGHEVLFQSVPNVGHSFSQLSNVAPPSQVWNWIKSHN